MVKRLFRKEVDQCGNNDYSLGIDLFILNNIHQVLK